MYLWTLKRGDKLGYDETHAVVVAAEYSNQAREIAGGTPGEQPPSIWYLPTTKVECIGTAVEGMTPDIVLCDFAS
jgi:hypothetical protein